MRMQRTGNGGASSRPPANGPALRHLPIVVRGIALALLAGLLGGCGSFSTEIPLPAELAVAAPERGPLPLKAALQLDELEGVVYRPLANGKAVKLSEPLKAGIEKVCHHVFAEVVLCPPGRPPAGVDVIVRPMYENITYAIMERATVQVRSTFRWRLIAPDGSVLYNKAVTGSAIRKVSTTMWAPTMEREQGEIYALSLEDHLRRVQEDLLRGEWRTVEAAN